MKEIERQRYLRRCHVIALCARWTEVTVLCVGVGGVPRAARGRIREQRLRGKCKEQTIWMNFFPKMKSSIGDRDGNKKFSQPQESNLGLLFHRPSNYRLCHPDQKTFQKSFVYMQLTIKKSKNQQAGHRKVISDWASVTRASPSYDSTLYHRGPISGGLAPTCVFTPDCFL